MTRAASPSQWEMPQLSKEETSADPPSAGVVMNFFSMKWSWVEPNLEFIASVFCTLAVCTFTMQPQPVEGLAANAFKIW